MKGNWFTTVLLLFFIISPLCSQEGQAPEIYLLTCGPGTETYSIYGHSALRIIIPGRNTDLVYNWGVFDFAAPNFAWKFAKGRLDYRLGVCSYDSFLNDYRSEKRWVVSQKANLESSEMEKLFNLISDNLKPENIKYRYDFFYDDCSTRIRDLFEDALDGNIIYPPEEGNKSNPSFRNLTGEFQKNFGWLNLGIDLIMGSPGDKKTAFRDRMFLPLYLKDGLSALTIRRNGKIVQLLKNPEIIVDFKTPVTKTAMIKTPFFIFSVLLVIIVIITGSFRKSGVNDILDAFLFTLFSVLAGLMIFFNFFTDHHQMKWNLNIIWLNPFVIFCLVSLLMKRNWQPVFRIIFYLALGFLAFLAILPQHINDAMFPLIVIMILRSSVRCGFSWNPLALPYLTQF